jgi:hypothetical protein
MIESGQTRKGCETAKVDNHRLWRVLREGENARWRLWRMGAGASERERGTMGGV